MCVHALRGEQFEQRWINWAFAQNWIHLLAMGYFVFSSACELVMLEFNFFLFAPVFVLTLNIQNLYFCSVLPLSPAGSLVWCYHAILSWNVHLELCSLWKCNLLAASFIFASSWFCALKDWPISFMHCAEKPCLCPKQSMRSDHGESYQPGQGREEFKVHWMWRKLCWGMKRVEVMMKDGGDWKWSVGSDTNVVWVLVKTWKS